MKTSFFLLFILVSSTSIAQLSPIGQFDHHQDVGNPKKAGSAVYNEKDQTYTITGAGINIWSKIDQFHFIWKKIKGDFSVSATIQFVGKGVADHRKIGIMAREELTTNSRYADACVHGDILSSLQYRESDTANTYQVAVLSYHPSNIEFSRKGNVYTFSAATTGENYKSVSKEMTLNDEVYVGLFICSHLEDVSETAIFSNVRITIPPAAGYTPYRDYIGSNLEIMDVATGLRKIIYKIPSSIQAPNWTKDGKSLIYNSSAGMLYKYDLADGKITELNTGPFKSNNNDHVISFDGKMLAISNHVGDKRISTLFTLPITGSDKPIQITSPDSGHSYLHSWSLDGKKLIFTGQRNKQYDIWTIDIASKKETALTKSLTLDDGPELSPNGQWIYFNSVRTGTMKLWRMKPDGSNQEQITYDEYNDWFPHFSPDGKQILFISFPKEIDPTQHPFYQKVYLRIMPASGGVPKTIGYIFGGQGTINVPSWSPDGKQVAFVSNTKM
jgi:Tol biopolymer transport system component